MAETAGNASLVTDVIRSHHHLWGVGMSVFISAGHSDSDPGAVAEGRREADIAVDFRTILVKCLSDLGITATTDGHGKQNLPLRDAVKLAKGKQIAIELHLNASANKTASGVETLSAPDDMALGAKLCAAISEELNIRNRGAKPENAGQHHRLAFVQAGGIILELFFITNPNDLAAYDGRKWPAARAVAKVIEDAYRA
jgi:N-acetylmuramoyl-L-alanine amidase